MEGEKANAADYYLKEGNNTQELGYLLHMFYQREKVFLSMVAAPLTFLQVHSKGRRSARVLHSSFSSMKEA